MRLTVDLILQSPQYISPSKNWTLGLRGCQVDVIENLGATADHFECIDLSDNEIIKLQNFPPLNRLTSLIVCNNRVSRIASDLFECLPNVVSLVLTNNRVTSFVFSPPCTDSPDRNCICLSSAKKLERLVLTENPVCSTPYYRSYVLFHLPNLRFFDFCRVRKEERDSANKQFGGEAGRQLIEKIATPRQPPQTGVTTAPTVASEARGLKPQQLEAIKKAIAQASSLEEIAKLEAALKNGVMPPGISIPSEETAVMETDGATEK
ncbi:small nuclear ribonucleoprotein polypeptide a [Cyclospora cayetanensis]|uniref:Small nuclear ribonucleoprotein polypeptide a n=1 Tax=Cyclospora cayetanensis TaxID=88456 RepID=A0A1D3CUV1_9EIME|nr:small nuclear ribonucleoprotein polypeptide a [Cyclospora cayetanensis]